MKKISIIVGLLLFAGLVAAQQFQNLSFETVSDSLPDQPAEWSTTEGLAVLRSEIIAADQQYAVNLTGDMSNKEYGFFTQAVPISLEGLKQFKVSAKLRLDELNDAEIVLYACSKKGKTFLHFETSDPLSVDAANDWVEQKVELWASAVATDLHIGVRMNGKGNVFVDDFRVEEISIPDTPMSTEATAYVDEILGLIKENSLYKDDLEITAMREMIRSMTGGAQRIADVQEVLPFFLKNVDKHSMYWSKEQMERWRAPKENTDSESKDTPAIGVTTGHAIDEDIAYLNMPGVGSGNPAELVYFADTLQQLIQNLDRPGLKGWVLDLRNNTGGNCWPMLAGIGPVLGEGICGYFALEEDYTSWSYIDGTSNMGDMQQTKVSITPYQLLNVNPRVAVLTGDDTASSGEVTAVAFRGRPNTKSFGQATAGYSTTNSNFELSDGSMLLLAVSVYADRAKQNYGKEIMPDVLVKNEKGKDIVLEKALEWLRN